ncbi:hypothetical protein [Roseivirga sp. UBA838]|uniref:hypothetical protein n=1 Tax=Roseivirga sp. UBA838 TaxID=1947393 RepID=UPI00257DF64C|nr:hypothetical protein [Roseivirga sp. UBA838]|tara:strand:- start:348 stop:2000 length:1653 start_codon:yes stop_codon:yes gene_type:complete
MSLNFSNIVELADDFSKIFTAGSDLDSLIHAIDGGKHSIDRYSEDNAIIQELKTMIDLALQQEYKADLKTLEDALNTAKGQVKEALDILRQAGKKKKNLAHSIDPTISPFSGPDCTFTHWAYGNETSSGALDKIQLAFLRIHNALNAGTLSESNGFKVFDKVLKYAHKGNFSGALGSNLRWESMTKLVMHIYETIAALNFVYEAILHLIKTADLPNKGITYGALHVKDLFGHVPATGAVSSTPTWTKLPEVFNAYLEQSFQNGTVPLSPAEQMFKAALSTDQYPLPAVVSEMQTSSGIVSRTFFWGKGISLGNNRFFTSINFFMPDYYTDHGVQSQSINSFTPIYALQGTTATLDQKKKVVPDANPFPTSADLDNPQDWFYKLSGDVTNVWVPVDYLDVTTFQCDFPTPPTTTSNNHLRVVTGFKLEVLASTKSPGEYDMVVSVQFGEIDLGETLAADQSYTVSLLNNGDYIQPAGDKEGFPLSYFTALSPAGKFSLEGTTVNNDNGIITNIAIGYSNNNGSSNCPVVQIAPTFYKADFMQPSLTLTKQS